MHLTGPAVYLEGSRELFMFQAKDRHDLNLLSWVQPGLEETGDARESAQGPLQAC